MAHPPLRRLLIIDNSIAETAKNTRQRSVFDVAVCNSTTGRCFPFDKKANKQAEESLTKRCFEILDVVI